MTTRMPRRAVFAALLLTASPREMTERSDGTSLTVRFDSISDLYAWLTAAGLNAPEVVIIPEHTFVDAHGRLRRSVSAYPNWHGWDIFAQADEPDTAPVTLDEPTTSGLADLVTVATREG